MILSCMAIQPIAAQNETDFFKRASSNQTPVHMLYWEHSDNGIPSQTDCFYILSTGLEGPSIHYYFLSYVGTSSAKKGPVTRQNKSAAKKALAQKAATYGVKEMQEGISSIEVALEVAKQKP